MRKLANFWKILIPLAIVAVGIVAAGTLNMSYQPTAKGPAPSHHVSSGGFRNPPGSPVREAGFTDMLSFLAKQLFATSAPEVPADHTLDKHRFDAQREAVGRPNITWLGHAAFIIRAGGKVIVTDPFLGAAAGPFGFGPKRFVDAPISGDELPEADVMLISHNHYDHLDARTIDAYRYKNSTQVIVPLGLGAFFTKRGYSKVLEQDWWDKWEQAGLGIITLPAVHFSGRGLGDRNKTLWASFAIETPDGKIWFSGDTARGDIFNEIGRRTGPYDLALVAIGAYEPRKIMEAVHVTPEEAIAIAQAIGAKRALGMHWGTIMLTPENPFDAPGRFRQAAKASGYGAENAQIMQIGQTLPL